MGDASCVLPLDEEHDSGLRNGFHWGGRHTQETNDSWEKFLPFPRSPRCGVGRVPVSDFLINFTEINTNVFIFCVPRSKRKTVTTTTSFHSVAPFFPVRVAGDPEFLDGPN